MVSQIIDPHRYGPGEARRPQSCPDKSTHKTVQEMEDLEHGKIAAAVLVGDPVQRPLRVVDHGLRVVEREDLLFGQPDPPRAELDLVPREVDFVRVLAWTWAPGVSLSKLGLVVGWWEILDGFESGSCLGS